VLLEKVGEGAKAVYQRGRERVSASQSVLLGRLGRVAYLYPFRAQMAKVQLVKLSEKSQRRGRRGPEMGSNTPFQLVWPRIPARFTPGAVLETNFQTVSSPMSRMI
jgi:hypothetical protein